MAYRKAEAYADWIWKRWLTEYIPNLNSRSKWQQEGPTVVVGELVWTLEKNYLRGQYPLANVTEVFVSDDGVVRAALVKKKTSLGFTSDVWLS